LAKDLLGLLHPLGQTRLVYFQSSVDLTNGDIRNLVLELSILSGGLQVVGALRKQALDGGPAVGAEAAGTQAAEPNLAHDFQQRHLARDRPTEKTGVPAFN
jgi:hypothetical protein